MFAVLARGEECLLGGVLWGIVILLVVLWVVVKLVLGIAGALFHLLLLIAVVVGVYALIKAGASRRIRTSVET